MTSTEHLVARVTELLALGHEARGFEVKGPGEAKGPFLAKIIRAALGLGNLRDGGLIVIGVNDKDLRSLGPGLTQEQAATWASYDDLSDTFALYADPPLQFHSELVTLDADTDIEALVCIVEVDEFADVPHICKKQFDAEKDQPADAERDRKGPDRKDKRKKEAPLRRGAVYVRPRHKPETSEIASAEQMRELLELATQKALARYVQTSQRAGLTLTPTDAADTRAALTEMFEGEQEDGWR